MLIVLTIAGCYSSFTVVMKIFSGKGLSTPNNNPLSDFNHRKYTRTGALVSYLLVSFDR